VLNELRILTAARDEAVSPSDALDRLTSALRAANERLWALEDEIRDYEMRQLFGPEFIECARAIYKTNDQRAAIKRQINEATHSSIVEEKAYADAPSHR
jgi:hypothetical protein